MHRDLWRVGREFDFPQVGEYLAAGRPTKFGIAALRAAVRPHPASRPSIFSSLRSPEFHVPKTSTGPLPHTACRIEPGTVHVTYCSSGVHWERKDKRVRRIGRLTGGSIRAGRQAFREWNGVEGPNPSASDPRNDADTIRQRVVVQVRRHRTSQLIVRQIKALQARESAEFGGNGDCQLTFCEFQKAQLMKLAQLRRNGPKQPLPGQPQLPQGG